MKILVTTPYDISPANYGGAVRTLEIAAALTRQAHDVKILSANNPVGKHYDYKSVTPISYFFNPFLVQKLKDVLSKFNPDLIIAAFPYQSMMLLPIARKYDIPIIYDAHNIEYLRFLRMGRPWVAGFVNVFEKLMIKHSVATICVSKEEESYIKDQFGKPTVLIPNGVNTRNSTPDTEREYTFCFFGALDYLPNEKALKSIQEMWPSIKAGNADATLIVVGRNPPEWSKNIQDWLVLGEVESIPETISRARILLCPINEGGGSRLKIIEAVANGLLVLSTEFGAEGFEQLVHHGSVVIAPLDEFIGTALSLIDNNIDHNAIAETAVPYDWGELVKELETLGLFDAKES